MVTPVSLLSTLKAYFSYEFPSQNQVLIFRLRKLSSLSEDVYDMNVGNSFFKAPHSESFTGTFYQRCISPVSNVKGDSILTGKQTSRATFKKCCFLFGLHVKQNSVI